MERPSESAHPGASAAPARTPRPAPASKTANPGKAPKEPLQVRVPQEVKRRFKAQAAIRGIAAHALFVEIWEHYERTRL